MVNGAELGREDMCAELGAESGDFRRNLVMKVVTCVLGLLHQS
jgi:hypothetical protein